jgi:ABC-type nitrate/sulfonate/bicarbonate transport system substrate-binding protein
MKSNRETTTKRSTAATRARRKLKPLRVGFLPENDCAPVVAAHEFGWFEHYGLEVELHSEASWKHIHDKFHLGLLDAAHAPASLPFLMNVGLTPEKHACVTGLVLSLEGNAITVSRNLSRLGVVDAATMGEHVFKERGRRTYAFGVACPLSPQYFLLCQWLKAANLPHSAVRIESAPSEQLFPLLKLGYLDGYCAGEPWGSVAVQAGVGECVATSAQLAPLHPEKVLMVRKDFAERRAEEHELLLAALIHACYRCDEPENRPAMCDKLAQARYVNAPADCLAPGLLGSAADAAGQGRGPHASNVFYRTRANEPSAAKAAWVTGQLYEFLRWAPRPAGLDGVFRPDIYRRARRLVSSELNDRPRAPRIQPKLAAKSSSPLLACGA